MRTVKYAATELAKTVQTIHVLILALEAHSATYEQLIGLTRESFLYERIISNNWHQITQTVVSWYMQLHSSYVCLTLSQG